jgi:hypothetical protein
MLGKTACHANFGCVFHNASRSNSFTYSIRRRILHPQAHILPGRSRQCTWQ